MVLKSTDNFDKLKSQLGSTAVAEAQLDRAADAIGKELMRQIWITQPVGGPDPMPGRSERPSIRQSHAPIEAGWLDSPRINDPGIGTRTIEIVSESPHVRFFTMWSGRPYLGTKPGADIVAVNAERLAFWWMNGARFPKVVPGENRKGFTPSTDFMEVAYGATEPFIWQQVRGVAAFALDKQFEGLT